MSRDLSTLTTSEGITMTGYLELTADLFVAVGAASTAAAGGTGTGW